MVFKETGKSACLFSFRFQTCLWKQNQHCSLAAKTRSQLVISPSKTHLSPYEEVD